MLEIVLMVAAFSAMTIALSRANALRVPFPHNIYISMAVGIAAYMTLYAMLDALYRTVTSLLSSWAGPLLLVAGLVLVGAVAWFVIRRWREYSWDPFGDF